MKKQPAKAHKQPKTRIELKIKSNTVTNNFILTPRNSSPRDHNRSPTQRHRYQQLKNIKEGKSSQQRRVTTDNNRLIVKKKFEQDTTGTHTPIVKRISVTQEFNKKKSSNSLLSTQRLKKKKKAHDKLSKNSSGQFNTNMFQRVLGIIIKDYREGRLKEKQLEQTLLELFDRKSKKKSIGKKKKQELYSQTFSNQFLRSAHKLTSQIIPKKRRSSIDDSIEERVLEREGFVNKIIVKGITTSTFLKEDPSVSQIRQNQGRNVSRDPSYNIHTSNSVKEINQQMREIQAQFNRMGQSSEPTLEDKMAIRIQRAWRQYRTKKLLQNIAFCRSNQNVFNIIEPEFTDEEGQQELKINNSQAGFHSPGKDSFKDIALPIRVQEESRDQYVELTQLVIDSLNERKVSKEECLKNILQYLKVPLTILENLNETEQVEQSVGADKVQEHQTISAEIVDSRINIFPYMNMESIEPVLSGEMNSFTNKYSSKDAVQNEDFYQGNSVIKQISELDKSLTFVHSQTLAAEAFKSINIQNIEEGLRTRQDALVLKKAKQMEGLTDQFFNNKLNKEQYLREKQKIDKWFKHQAKQLKRVKNSLMKSCNQARKLLDSDTTTLNKQKSQKMLKCLSDRYLQKGSWATQRQHADGKQFKKKSLRCERQQQIQSKEEQQNGGHNIDKSDELKQYKGQNTHKIENKQQKIKQPPKFQISPKMVRVLDEQDEINEYKYEEIEKIIEQDDDNYDGLVQMGSISHKASDQFEPNFEESVQESQMSLINNLINEHNHKFKYLCNDDKQDIFQFLFLDLILQVFTEAADGQNRILKAAEAYISKAKRLKKIPKGIKTSIAASKDYLNILSKVVLGRTNGLKNMSFPMGPSAIEMLRYMRDQIVDAQDEDAVSSTLVLPIDTFEKVSHLPELELKLQRYYEDDEKEQNRLAFLKTALNINNKSLFDSLNQMLDHERPYGVWGKPFPWKKTLAVDRKWTQKDEKKKLQKCVQKTIQSCSYLCGIMVDKEDSLFGSHRVSEEYVMQIREDRLSKMLANELIENEERWIFYDDEQTEIMMEISSFITKKLIKELVLETVSIGMKLR